MANIISNEDYERMMLWALGEDWKLQNLKDAAKIFSLVHPELRSLATISTSSPHLRIGFYVSQIKDHWSEYIRNQNVVCEMAMYEEYPSDPKFNPFYYISKLFKKSND
jgi:hypothetical protein